MKKIIFLITLIALVFTGYIQGQENSISLMNVDYESLVSEADLSFDTPVTRSEEGMPVGNGQMGSLVWTTPSAVHFQMNRTDVFSAGCPPWRPTPDYQTVDYFLPCIFFCGRNKEIPTSPVP